MLFPRTQCCCRRQIGFAAQQVCQHVSENRRMRPSEISAKEVRVADMAYELNRKYVIHAKSWKMETKGIKEPSDYVEK